MDDKDLGNKKINNEQDINEGFSGENLPDDYNPSKGKLKPEIEKDRQGETNQVDRARNDSSRGDENESQSQESNAEKIEKNAENRDHNYDLSVNRHPDSNPENNGNLQLDES